jgi:hypothetical protein
MDINLIIAVGGGLLTVLGLLLGPISRYLERREADRLQAEQFQKMMEQHPAGSESMTFTLFRTQMPPPEPKPKGLLVLIIFAVVVAIFGLGTAIYFWPYLRGHLEKLIFAVWLFLTMVFGMFVQVANEFRRSKRQLSEIEATDLLFPLLFSIVVFYTIWATVGSASHSFFSFYAAFLNGFFWETAVAQAKPPKPPGS